MEYDKVINSALLEAKLTAIADAIRSKTGNSSLLSLEEMASAVAGISGGGAQAGNLSGKGFNLHHLTAAGAGYVTGGLTLAMATGEIHSEPLTGAKMEPRDGTFSIVDQI